MNCLIRLGDMYGLLERGTIGFSEARSADKKSTVEMTNPLHLVLTDRLKRGSSQSIFTFRLGPWQTDPITNPRQSNGTSSRAASHRHGRCQIARRRASKLTRFGTVLGLVLPFWYAYLAFCQLITSKAVRLLLSTCGLPYVHVFRFIDQRKTTYSPYICYSWLYLATTSILLLLFQAPNSSAHSWLLSLGSFIL